MRDLLPVFEAAAKGVAFVGGYLADALSERLKAFARYEDGDYLTDPAVSLCPAEGSPEVALSPRPSGEHPNTKLIAELEEWANHSASAARECAEFNDLNAVNWHKGRSCAYERVIKHLKAEQ